MAVRALAADPYALAERRLGRPLTYAERHIDIVQLDRDLAAGKQALYEAVDKEKRRAVNAFFRYRRHVRLDVTPQMRSVLVDLYRTGQQHAWNEVEKTSGFRPRQMARADDDIAKMEAQLQRALRKLQGKVEQRTAEAGADLMIGDIAVGAASRAVLQMPGAMAVAAQLVSGSIYTGMGSVFDATAGLFESWTYSAVMDSATCDPCAELDGSEYESWEAIQEVLPDGGPNPDCDGEGRCRCRAVPNASEQVTGSDLSLPGVAPAALEDSFAPEQVGLLDTITDGPATRYLDNHYDAWGAKLSQPDLDALQQWRLESGYRQIGNYLRNGVEQGDVAKTVRALDRVIAHAPEIDRGIHTTVYRGVTDLRAALGGGDVRVGQTFTERNYVATSTERRTAEDYSQYSREGGIIEVELPEGSRGAWMRSAGGEVRGGEMEYEPDPEIRALWDKGGNKELLLARGQEYVITGVRRTQYDVVVTIRPVAQFTPEATLESSAPLDPGMPEWWQWLPEHARQPVEGLNVEEAVAQRDRLKKYVRPLKQHEKAGTRKVHPEKVPALERRIHELDVRIKDLGGAPRVRKLPPPAPRPAPAPVAPAPVVPQPGEEKVQEFLARYDKSGWHQIPGEYGGYPWAKFDDASAFEGAPEKTINIDRLTPTQDYVDPRPYHGDPHVPIDVIHYNGRFYVFEGHNRIAAALREGRATMQVRVLNAGGKLPADSTLRRAVTKAATKAEPELTTEQLLQAGAQLRASGTGYFTPTEQRFVDAVRDYQNKHSELVRAAGYIDELEQNPLIGPESYQWKYISTSARIRPKAGETNRDAAKRWLENQHARHLPKLEREMKAAFKELAAEPPQAERFFSAKSAFTNPPSDPKFLSNNASHVQREASQSLDFLDSVLKIPVPEGRRGGLRIRFTTRTTRASNYGHYQRGGEININPSSTTGGRGSPMETFYHEYGHYLDSIHLAPPGAYGYASETASEMGMQDLMHAIYSSRSYAKLLDRQRAARAGRGWDSESFVAYLLSEKELFARAFAQYMVRKSERLAVTDQERTTLQIARQHIARRAYDGDHWYDDDFQPIEAAFDRYFTRLGWLR